MFSSPHPPSPVSSLDLLTYVFGTDESRDLEEPVRLPIPILSSRVGLTGVPQVYISPECPEQEHISKKEARGLIKRLAKGLKVAGLQHGDTICLYSNNSIYYPIISLAAVAAGGVWTGMNPGLSYEERLRHLNNSSAKFLFCSPDLAQSASGTAEACGLDGSRVFSITSLSVTSQPSNSWINLLSHGMSNWEAFNDEHRAKTTTACLYPTSGTSGLPKLAMITHYNLVAAETLVNGIEQRQYPVRQIMNWPMFHLASLLWSHITPLRAGWTAYIPSKFQPAKFLDYVQRFQITDTGMAPAMMIGVLRSTVPTVDKKRMLSTLRSGMCGSAPVGSELQSQWRELIPSHCPWTCAYGMTELTGVVTKSYYPSDDMTGSIGELIPNTEARLIGEDGTEIKSPGQPGELLLRGPTVFKGYHQNETATKEAFHRDGFLLTGDVAYLDEKSQKWFILDRKKELIKVRGCQVAPVELEGVLLSHPGVAEAAVVGVTGPDGAECPRAYVVRSSQLRVTGEELARYLGAKLSSYKRLTGGVYFLEALPRNGSGKVLKRQLREEAACRKTDSRL
ncbi:hypothetical protein NM208_g13619 [Fusarium decemcellulare]|uniref:Uncharacterized protein n=1 Tax=Fusarium decemcellulare TaxID=57161 RepID=A0ACC1RLP8_9HYPO|nr:hypothetical protein NM208_g13619 [Fusarium decemcellulare]